MMAENKTLMTEVDRLRSEIEKVEGDRTAREEQQADLTW